ncbi:MULTISPECIES: sigma-70 family RNA polymerase sigma factor [unclassified Caballeronia]|uniref:sigma-70 family RNA polymerase sigma factor n=1 Tax=unclassified Caballeronia TaxID=2646786 RepID=UPI002027CAE3|nr:MULTISPECIES: sigma-70 family RNA polymerase sigma factor [unclassified Caballeronia]
MKSSATMTLPTFDDEDQAATVAQRAEAGAKAERRLAALLEASINGDKHAYHRFLDELARHLRARLRKQLRQQDADVEDLIQEVLIAVHKGLDTFRPDVPLTAWISAIVRYKLADHFRANFRRGEIFEPLDDDLPVSGASPIDSLEARRDLTRLLDTLPERQRRPIEHTKLLGLSIAETAATTGLTESAVKIGVHRGLKALAAKIKGKTHEN